MSTNRHGTIRFPKFLYHGTMLKNVPHFRERILDSAFWNPIDRDFGAAFYTTISFKQAVDWAVAFEMKNPGETGCILKIEVRYEQFPSDPSKYIVFLSDTNPEWVNFIVDHRLECKDSGLDPCGKSNHPSIIIGPMADNKMNDVHALYESMSNIITDKYSWYYDQITMDKQQRKLDSLELGNQIAFSDENFDKWLIFKEYYVFNEEEGKWIDYEKDKDPI